MHLERPPDDDRTQHYAPTFASLPPELVLAALQTVGVHSVCAVACSCRELRECVDAWLPPLARESLARHSIAAGSLHSASVNSEGALFTFGTDPMQRGFLGHGPATRIHRPLRLVVGGERFISVATHSFHTLALTDAGRVYSFGHNQCGQLGHGDEITLARPRRVEALAGVRAVSISAGQQHSLVLSAHGGVYAFGSGFGGKLGLGDQRPRALPARVGKLNDVRVLAAGSHHSLAATRGGRGRRGRSPRRASRPFYASSTRAEAVL